MHDALFVKNHQNLYWVLLFRDRDVGWKFYLLMTWEKMTIDSNYDFCKMLVKTATAMIIKKAAHGKINNNLFIISIQLLTCGNFAKMNLMFVYMQLECLLYWNILTFIKWCSKKTTIVSRQKLGKEPSCPSRSYRFLM